MPRPSLNRRLGGLPYPNMAAHFVTASTQYGTIADNAALSMGVGVSFSIACWLQADAGLAANAILVGKGRNSGTPAQMEYHVGYDNAAHRIYLRISDGASTPLRQITSATPLPLAVWHFFVGTYDGATLSSSINGLAFETVASSITVRDGTAPFRIGASDVPDYYWGGDLDSVGVWKRPLSITEVGQLYNNAVGMAYRDLTPALKTSLVAWYNLDGNMDDIHGGNNLTNTGGVSFTTGKR